MADTSVCCLAKTVFGNVRANVYSITVGANATMAIGTGMQSVDFLLSNLQSCTTAGNIAITARQGAAGTSIVSSIAISGCTDGDDIHLVAFSFKS